MKKIDKKYLELQNQNERLINELNELKQTIHSLKQIEDQYQLILNTTPHGIQLSDLNGKIIYSNPALHKMYGYEDNKITGKYIWDFLANEEEKIGLQKYYQKIINENPTPETYLSKGKRKDGKLIDILINWDFVYDSNNKPKEVISVVTDTTLQLNIEQELVKSENRFRYAMKASSDGFFDWKIQTDEIYFSPGFFSMLGYNENEFPSKIEVFEKLIHPEDYERCNSLRESYLEGKIKDYSIELRYKNKTEDWVWIHSRGKVFEYDIDGKPIRFVGTNVNINQRRKNEENILYEKKKAQMYLEVAAVVFVVIGIDQKVVEINQKGCNILGYTKEEVIGKNWFEKFIKKK